MEEWIDQTWDARYWDIALKSEGPTISAYNEIKSQVDTAAHAVPIDELTPEDRAWMRSTR